MKARFNSLDVLASVKELQSLIGLRVNQVYDVNRTTYLIKFTKGEEKAVLLFESGIRFHTTTFDWPKNKAPSGFCMKLRKHLKNKRLEKITQLGADRIVDMQFGIGEVANHVILELFDRGNIVLTDHSLIILNILRPHTEGDVFKFAVREVYPVERAKHKEDLSLEEKYEKILSILKPGQPLRVSMIQILDYGPGLVEHALALAKLDRNCKLGKDFNPNEHGEALTKALGDCDNLVKTVSLKECKGIIVQKCEPREAAPDYFSNQEYHPFHFKQHEARPCVEYDTFNMAVDEFYSSMESQKIEMVAVQKEREIVKRVDKIRLDQADRVMELDAKQKTDKRRAELITSNVEIVDEAIRVIRSAIAAQLSWGAIEELVLEATRKNDPVASLIKGLKLQTNHITLLLRDPYAEGDEEEETVEMLIDIDLAVSAHGNAKLYYDDKKTAALKQKKTIESQEKALKSAQKKVQQALKDIKTMSTISKVRKTYWFEKFYWFISSENYLVIGGRDSQQNEIIVKRYMKTGDIYVHADIHGASTIIIKNPSCNAIPPKTLNEAGMMAICYSVGWEAKWVCNAWWVHSHQVSKSAPTGEYLTPGSFMIRGHKNYLLPNQLALGFGFLFRMDESCLERHEAERKTKLVEEEEEDFLSVGSSFHSSKDDEEVVEESENSIYSEALSTIESDHEEFLYPNTELTPTSKPPPIIPNLVMKNGSPQKDTSEETLVGSLVPRSLVDYDDKSTISSDKEKDNQGVKRGQRGKLKKIKEKYKDQDEEEKRLRMAILQSAGAKKEPKKSKKVEKEERKEKKVVKPPRAKIEREDDEVETEEVLFVDDCEMLNLLTGQPLPDDELLFALPVVAPYSALLNYKYKVKMIPGSSKRGKAARMALEICLRTKDAPQREKDLLKSVDDQQLSRNFPGKVKLASPRLMNSKK